MPLTKSKSSALEVSDRWHTGAVAVERVSRAEARVAQVAAIKAVARQLIAERGVAGLSLREVSRELGMVSSALYRYFATRDELLTALIIDAYSDLGTAVEQAEAKVKRTDFRKRWRATCRAVRAWALENPNEYALIFGTPVPGYQAPLDTVVLATRVPAVMGSILRNALEAAPAPASAPPARAQSFLDVGSIEAVMPGVDSAHYVPALMVWTYIFGHLNFELFGHHHGSVTNPDVMFDRVVEQLADFLDLP